MNASANHLKPRHVAIVMDGNGRWAKKRFMPRIAGHKAGVESVRQVVKSCIEKKIEVLSLFAFSSENWRRPEQEVDYLMGLFITALQKESNKLHEQNVQLRIVGERTRFAKELQEYIAKAEALTAGNTGLKLIIAANYGSKWEICEAVKKILLSGENNIENITPELIQANLVTADIPDPDLFIRTSGEQRISNFMLWQLAYAELYFTETLWPDFTAEEFEKALAYFSSRERRFGLTSEQLRVDANA